MMSSDHQYHRPHNSKKKIKKKHSEAKFAASELSQAKSKHLTRIIILK